MAIEFNVVFEENDKSFDADFGVITTVSPNDIYIGPNEPTDLNIKLWIDTDEQEPNYYDVEQTDALLDKKQDILTAGENITIENNVISASGGGVSDHSQLTNLDYEHSGHTGFAAASDIPTKVSELENNVGYAKTEDLAAVATSGSYNDLTDKPEWYVTMEIDDTYNITAIDRTFEEIQTAYQADKNIIAKVKFAPFAQIYEYNYCSLIGFTENAVATFGTNVCISNTAGILAISIVITSESNEVYIYPVNLSNYAMVSQLAAKQDKLTAGDNITIKNNVISATGYELPIASASVLGGIKVGTGLSIDADGVLSLALTNANGVSF